MRSAADLDGTINSTDEVIIYTDGAARGNPGPAGAGWVILSADGHELERGSLSLGVATNNAAEYRAVIEALQRARAIGARRVQIRSDSELLIKQLNNEYQVRNDNLLPLFKEVRQLSSNFHQVSYQHIPRENNRQADELASAAAVLPETQESQTVPRTVTDVAASTAAADATTVSTADATAAASYHIMELRVRYGETDQMGVAYYANYFDWFTEARTALMRDGGMPYKEIEAQQIFLPVREAHCEYLRPVRYDDQLRLITQVTRLTPVRFEFHYTLMKAGYDEPCAVGWTKHAFVDHTGQPFNLKKRFPEIWERLAKAAAKYSLPREESQLD